MARERRVALLLAGAALVLAAGGALWFIRFAAQARRDPGLVYRDPGTLDKLLKRANEAERAGDRATAITVYRFLVAVGQGAGGRGGRGGRGPGRPTWRLTSRRPGRGSAA